MKVPTQAKADTVELCHFVLQWKKLLLPHQSALGLIFKDWRQYWKLAIINIDSSDVGGASWWVELVGGWGWP